ncbi:MAG: 3-dehydroquinate synthase [Clostridia bacterium]|nr:3-dehydroquinate synthase [Clostridia bacterium]
MKKLTIRKPTTYEVFITDKKAELEKTLSAALLHAKKIAVMTDENVFAIYGRFFDAFAFGGRVRYLVVDGGEKCKTFASYQKMIGFLSENGFTRADAVIAFGGGAVSDAAGFAAATYMRGMDLFVLPTTVIGMIDASVGSKSAVDFDGIKNLVGAFYPPKSVIIYTPFLKSLNDKQIKSGRGEVVKYAFLCPEKRDKILSAPLGENLVYECLKIKKNVVEKDPYDIGERRLLNLGHTLGHAIESLSGFTLSHGECVAIGLRLALDASKELNGIDDETYLEAARAIENSACYKKIDIDFEAIKKALKTDKKYDGENMSFVAFDKEMKPYITKITIDRLIETIKR